jgi:hypothetical protein
MEKTGVTYREWLDRKIYMAVVDGLPVPGPIELEYQQKYGEAAYYLSFHQARIDAGLFDSGC